MSAGISAISYSVPSGILKNSELELRFGHSYNPKILSATGVLERRVAAENECASDFAFRAAKKILDAGVDAKSVDLLIMCTQTPDYQMPSTACILQTRLGISSTVAAFDINLGCSQFVYGLAVARAWVESGMAHRALVLSGETPTRTINPHDEVCLSLFGDGGAAALVEDCPDGGFLSFDFGTNGRGYKDLIRPESGMRRKVLHGNAMPSDEMFMDGGRIFLFAYKFVPPSVETVMKSAGLDISDVKLFAFHQASELIVKSAAAKAGIPSEKLHYKLHDIGNIGGSSVAAVIVDAYLAGRVKTGDIILMSAFGTGLSWASATVKIGKNFLGAFVDADFSGSPERPESQKVH